MAAASPNSRPISRHPVGHDSAAPAARSNAPVDHDRAARWVTLKAPLKPFQQLSSWRAAYSPPDRCRIVSADGSERQATIDECEGLESQAVWDPEHVDERIMAHYQGRPSVFVESLKLERP